MDNSYGWAYQRRKSRSTARLISKFFDTTQKLNGLTYKGPADTDDGKLLFGKKCTEIEFFGDMDESSLGKLEVGATYDVTSKGILGTPRITGIGHHSRGR